MNRERDDSIAVIAFMLCAASGFIMGAISAAVWMMLL